MGFFENKNVFEKMAKKPILINVSRGGLIVTEDLVGALRDGLISGVGLDILDGIGDGVAEHPIFGFDHVVITPHSACRNTYSCHYEYNHHQHYISTS